MIFNKYAKIYDLLNKSKNYKKEINYFLKILKNLNLKNFKNILDVGCGTGSHASYLKKKGFNISGVDISSKMLKIARKKNPKIKFKNINSKISKKFDICYSFFHVVSYLDTNKKLNDFFKYVSLALIKNGYFIFDFWHKNSVIQSPPKEKIKLIQNKKLKIIRQTRFEHIKKKEIIKVFFTFFLLNKKKFECFEETHKMRYFSQNKLNIFLKKNNLKIIKHYGWLSFKKPTNKWYSCIVAKKI
jgi:ubiquinone/menaquinone biosynthesis C-methylase UbiE